MRGTYKYLRRYSDMPRRNSYRGRFKMTKEQYLSAKYYALRYNEWQLEYAALCDTARAITYSDMPKGSMSTESPVEDAAIKAEKIHGKIALVERVATEAAGDLAPYILKAVTNRDITYHQLKTLTDIPCGRDLFNHCRRKFYYILYQLI